MTTGLSRGIRFPITADARTASAMGRVKAQLGGIKGALASVNDNAKRLGRSMRNIGRGMSFAVTAPIAAGGAYILKASGDFEAAMNKVQALSSAAEGDFKALKEQAMSLGSSTKFSASQAAGAMGYLAQAGFDARQIMAAMPSTLELAAAANMDLATSADIVSNVLTGFNRKVGDLADVNDVLVKAMTSSNTDLRMLGDAMKYVGPVASSAKMRFNEVTAALGLLGNAGIQGEMGGTALRGILTKLLSPSKAASKVMAELGINVMNADGTLKDLGGIMDELAPHADNTAALMEIFGQRAGPAMAALLAQGADALREFEDILNSSGGTASKIATAQMEGLNGAVTEMKSAFEGLAIAIGESGLLEWVTGVVKGITGLVRKISALNPQVLKFTTIFAGVAAITGPVLAFFGLVTVGIYGLVSALGLLATAIWPITAVVAAIAAVAAVGTYVYRNWDGVGGFFRNLWDDVAAVHVRGWTTLKAEAEKYSPETVAFIEKSWSALAQHFSSIWVAIRTGHILAWENIKTSFTGTFSADQVVKPSWSGLAEWFGALFDNIKFTFQLKWIDIKLMAMTWAQDFRDIGRNIVSGLSLGIEEKWNDAVSAIGKVMNLVTRKGEEVPEVQSPSRVFKRIGGFLMEGLKLGIEGGAPVARKAMEEASEGVIKPLQAGGFGQIAGTVKSAFSSLFQTIVSGSGKASDAIKRLGEQLLAMALEKSIFGMLGALMPKAFGAGGFMPLVANANGNAFQGGRVTPFAAGGVVSSPTLFPMRGGIGMMGEAGPEGILPLTRINGRLGVHATGGGQGGGGTVVQVIDQRSSGAPVETRRERGPDGRELIIATITDAEREGRFDGMRRARNGTTLQKVRRG